MPDLGPHLRPHEFPLTVSKSHKYFIGNYGFDVLDICACRKPYELL